MVRKKQMKKGIIEIEASLTIFNVAELQNQILKILKNSNKIEVDLKDITECDTAGIQLLYSLKKSCLSEGKDFSLLNPSDDFNEALNRMSIPLETLECQ